MQEPYLTGIPLQRLHKTSQDQNKKEKKQRTEKKRVTKLNVQRFVFPIILNTPPQTVESPRAFAKCLAFTEGNAFVSVSAVMSSVEQ